MRINVYSQELILGLEAEQAMPQVTELVTKEADTGVTYSAVRLFLHSSERLHDHVGDDDRSAITFWLPKSDEKREEFACRLEQLAHLVRLAEKETGLD